MGPAHVLHAPRRNQHDLRNALARHVRDGHLHLKQGRAAGQDDQFEPAVYQHRTARAGVETDDGAERCRRDDDIMVAHERPGGGGDCDVGHTDE